MTGRGKELWVSADHVLTPNGVLDGAAVCIADGQIKSIERIAGGPIDGHGAWLVPGFIDIHIHGGAGNSVENKSDVDALAAYLPSTGVTAFVPTLSTSSPESTLAFLRDAAAATQERHERSAEILGSHLEGPFLSTERKGAHLATLLRRPAREEAEEWIRAARGTLARVTLASEEPNAADVIALLNASGVQVSLGHSNATYEEAIEAVGLGVTSITHTYNAMSPLNHRAPGVVGMALMSDSVTAELVADGAHVHPAAAMLLLRVKGAARVAVVTDGTRLMGLPAGAYEARGRRLQSDGVAVRDGEGRLAGSATTLAGALRNLLTWGVNIEQTCQLLSSAPARVLGVDSRKGHLAPGFDADMVVLDDAMTPQATYCRGIAAWRRDA